MKLIYGTMDEFGLDFKRSHVHRSKNEALLDEFVESGSFKNTVLKDGDTVEFLYFMGGGQ